MSKNLTKEQHQQVAALAQAVYQATSAAEEKKAVLKSDAMKQALLTNRDMLDAGVAVKFTTPNGETVKGTLRTKYVLTWEFVEE